MTYATWFKLITGDNIAEVIVDVRHLTHRISVIFTVVSVWPNIIWQLVLAQVAT